MLSDWHLDSPVGYVHKPSEHVVKLETIPWWVECVRLKSVMGLLESEPAGGGSHRPAKLNLGGRGPGLTGQR